MEKLLRFLEKTITVSFFLLVIFVPLLLTPFNYELFEYNKMMVTYGITAVIVGAWVSTMIIQKKLNIAKTPFDIPIVLFLCSQLVATLFSTNPHVSWLGYYSRFNGGMVSLVSYTLLFYAFVSTVKAKELASLLKATLISAIGISLYAIFEHFGHSISCLLFVGKFDTSCWVQDVQSRVFATLGQPNWLAAYVVALLPFTFVTPLQSFLDQKKKVSLLTTIPFFVLTAIFFVTLLYTRSRSGLIAFVGIDLLFWAVLLIKKFTWKRIRLPFFVTHGIVVLLLVISGTGIPKLDGWITIQGITAKVTKSQPKEQPQVPVTETGPVLEVGGTESGVIRTYVWQGAINAWNAHWKNRLIGTGVETFAFAFYQYKPIGHNLTSEWDFLYNKAHNEYLNFLTTTGLFGLGSYLLFIVSIIWWFVKTIKKNKEHTILVTACFASWCSLLVTNFFGFSVVVTQLLLFLVPAGCFLVVRQPVFRTMLLPFPTQKHQRIALGILSTITLLCLLGLGIGWWADKTFATGFRASRNSQYTHAYAPLSKAVLLNPFEPLYHDEYANALGSLALAAFEANDATLAAHLATVAIQENEQALKTSPNNVIFWKTKTKILYSLSSIDESYLPVAVIALEHAYKLSPNDPKIVYNLAILSGKLLDTNKAISYLTHAIALKPNYKDAYYALFIFYRETGRPDKARETIQTYLTTIDSRDEEFKNLLE